MGLEFDKNDQDEKKNANQISMWKDVLMIKPV